MVVNFMFMMSQHRIIVTRLSARRTAFPLCHVAWVQYSELEALNSSTLHLDTSAFLKSRHVIWLVIKCHFFIFSGSSDLCSRNRILQVSEKSETDRNLIYYFHYVLYMFTLTLYTFSQPLYHVCADFSQHIGIDSSTTVCNYLPKVTNISDFNSVHLCLQESPKCKVSTLSSNVNVICLLTYNFNL
jgi:hypothetical protein